MRLRILLAIACFTWFSSYGQESEHEESHEEEHFKHHKIGLTIGPSHLSQGEVDAGSTFPTLPSWEVAYSYSFNERWFLGLAVHLILEDFEVERIGRSNPDEDEIILREKPVAPSIVAGYRATKHSSFAIGNGAEFASGETFFMTHFSYVILGVINWGCFKFSMSIKFVF